MKVSVPTSLNDISLRTYQKLQKAIESAKDPLKYELEAMQIKISIICNLTKEQVYNIEMVDIWKISRKIDEVLRQSAEHILKFELEGKTFGWIPNLDEMNYGEFIDLNDNISEWESMHIAMGVLYRPIVESDKEGRYNIENYDGDKYKDILLDMPMNVVVGSMVFFWNLGIDCVKAILKSLDQKEMNFQKQLNLVESGVGLQHSMNLQTEMLQNLMKLQN